MDIKHDADIDTSVPVLIWENGISEGNNMCWCYIELTLFDFLYTTVCCGLVDHPHKCHVHVINMLHTVIFLHFTLSLFFVTPVRGLLGSLGECRQQQQAKDMDRQRSGYHISTPEIQDLMSRFLRMLVIFPLLLPVLPRTLHQEYDYLRLCLFYSI
ncbi:transmembrane protein, putative [Medicago truncatula]|nr:transmembrane protein, putative [Medicago truncatula]